MKNFKNERFSRDRKPGGFPQRGGFSRPSFGGGRREGGRPFSVNGETHKAVCSKCNMACEVPFIPNGKKPVFCQNCYVRDDGRPTPQSFEKRSYASGERGYAPKEHAAPAPRPVEDSRIGALLKELAVIHTKLDTLMARMERAPEVAPAKAPAVKKVAKKVAKKK